MKKDKLFEKFKNDSLSEHSCGSISGGQHESFCTTNNYVCDNDGCSSSWTDREYDNGRNYTRSHEAD